MRTQDGASVTIGGRDFTAVDEPPDEDGHGWFGFVCDTCGDSGKTSWAENHECHECPGCGEFYPKLPVMDGENGQRYCSDNCHDETSERYWTEVWSA